jgi:hypothetical protein
VKAPLAIAVVIAALGGACDSGGTLAPPPSVVTFDLRNDGISTVYLRESCLLDFKITSLGEPVREIARQGACPCDCAVATCPVCGPCYEGPREVAVGATWMTVWAAVNVTYEPRQQGSTCERKHTLPAGSYRIDVPVYPTAQDVIDKTNARTATQTFSLPSPGDINVTVSVGASP